MGSEKHKKHSSKKRRREEDGSSSDDSSGSSDSGSSEHRHRKHSKEKKKHKSKHKHKSDHHKAEKKMLKEAKKFLKKKLKEEGASGGKLKPVAMVAVPADFKVTPITSEDYFQRNTEFSKWLKDQKCLMFNELSSTETHSLFGEFVDAWNGRKLSEDYYAGNIQSTGVARTSFKWGFTSAGGASSAAELLEQQEQERADAVQRLRHERKGWRADQKELMDELLPKATGREAMIEKKAARREAAREREASPEMNRLIGGGDIMGGDDSFAAARAREARRVAARDMRQSIRNEEKDARAATARANEDARMAAFRDLVGKGPISIPRRN